jgi:adenosine deaminase
MLIPMKNVDFDLRQYPKAELHRHLECSMRLSTICELAPQVGLELPSDAAELKKALLVTEPMTDLSAVLNKFLATQKVLESEEILERITFEIIEDAFKEGLKILELRFAPTFIQGGHEHLSFEMIHRSIVRGMARAKHLPIAVGLIATIQRTLPVAAGARVVDFAIEHKDTILALDLADNEVGFDPGPFASIFQKGRKAGLRVTIHAGEANVVGSEDRVREAIDLLGAERIGHGVQIHRSPEMMKYVSQKQIPLELCPTSNWLTAAVETLGSHPIRKLMAAGVAVTINSDDPGVFDIDLTNEYQLLSNSYAFTKAEFDRCNDIAAACSFIPLAEKQRVWPRPINMSLAPKI